MRELRPPPCPWRGSGVAGTDGGEPLTRPPRPSNRATASGAPAARCQFYGAFSASLLTAGQRGAEPWPARHRHAALGGRLWERIV